MEVFRFCRSECMKWRRVVSLTASMPADMFTDIKGYIHSVHPPVYSALFVQKPQLPKSSVRMWSDLALMSYLTIPDCIWVKEYINIFL